MTCALSFAPTPTARMLASSMTHKQRGWNTKTPFTENNGGVQITLIHCIHHYNLLRHILMHFMDPTRPTYSAALFCKPASRSRLIVIDHVLYVSPLLLEM